MGVVAMSKTRDVLALALSDGSLAVISTRAGAAQSLKPRGSSGPARAVLFDGQSLWWTDRTSDALYRWRPGDGSEERIELPAAPLTPAGTQTRALVFAHGKLWCVQPSRTLVVDAATHQVAGFEAVLPAQVAADLAGASLFAACAGDRLALLGARRDASGAPWLSAWVSEGSGDWRRLGDCPAPMLRLEPGLSPGAPGVAAEIAVPDACALGLSSEALVVIGRDGVLERRLRSGDDEPPLRPLPPGMPSPSAGQTVALGGGSAWWVQDDRVFRADLATGAFEVYLPWSEGGIRPTCVVADADGAWVGTTKGVRRIEPRSAPDPRFGYGGFVRAPFGDGAGPASETARALEREIATWMGVPYRWGGSTREGVDCSGFVMAAYRAVGVHLPHGSRLLATARGGVPVTDELRFGDVLIFPGHCAIYTGAGMTAETVSGANGVSFSHIWRRGFAVVRRFIDLPDRGRELAAGRSGGRRSARTSKPSTRK